MTRCHHLQTALSPEHDTLTGKYQPCLLASFSHSFWFLKKFENVMEHSNNRLLNKTCSPGAHGLCIIFSYVHLYPYSFFLFFTKRYKNVLVRRAQCLIEVIRSSGEEMWRVDAYQIPYYSRGIAEGEKRTHPGFADWPRTYIVESLLKLFAGS